MCIADSTLLLRKSYLIFIGLMHLSLYRTYAAEQSKPFPPLLPRLLSPPLAGG